MKYKKICILTLTFIMLLTSFGCKKNDDKNNNELSNQEDTLAQSSKSNSYPSRDGDIVHEQNIFEDSEWIYYLNAVDGSTLYKKSIDGGKNIKLSDSYLGSYCLEGDWIYYSNYKDNGSLYRMKTDGTAKEKLNSDETSSINVSKEWVYYVNSSDNRKPYKVKKEGSDRTKLGEDSVDTSMFVAEGDWIYYNNSSDINCIYKIGMDGRGRLKLTNAPSFNFCISKDWIYYSANLTEGDEYPTIYKIKRDGTKETPLKDGEPHELYTDFEVSRDYIYYDTYNSDDALYRIKTDGTEHRKISAEGEHINSLTLSKDSMLFESTFYNLNLCKMDFNSKSETLIDKSPVYDKQHLAEWIFYNDMDRDLGLTIDKKNIYDYNKLTERTTSEVRILGSTSYFLVRSGDSNSLYKLSIDNPEPIRIAEGNILTYDIEGDFIYYYDANDLSLYRIKADGTDKKNIDKREIQYFQVHGDWIYLIPGEGTGIYKIKTNGSSGDSLVSDIWIGDRFVITEDWIYFGDDTGLSKIKTDGTGRAKLFEVEGGIGKLLSIREGRLYYETVFAEGPESYGWISGLYSMKLDGTDKETLLEGTIKSWSVIDTSVYYNKIVRDINIIRSKPDGTGRQTVVSGLRWY